jgi:hypothetical protein
MPAPKFKVEYVDGSEEEVKLLPKAQVEYERETKKSLGEGFGESLEEVYNLAWFAAGKPNGSLDSWLDSVEAVVGIDQEETELDPPSTEASPD